jgi:CubicO group peptidase (beta-lactamase class C family)
MSYADYVRTRILEPAGMADSGYDSYEAVIKRRASGYSPDGRHAPFIDMSLPHGAGALYATADDLVKWTEVIDSGKLISRESYRKMVTPFLNNYGYGLNLREQMGKKVEEHGGGIFGFNTYLLRVPEDRLAVVVLANRNTPGTGKIAQSLAEMYYGKEVPPRPLRVEISLTAAQMDAVAGEYELRPGFVMKVWRDGNQLKTQATGQPEVAIFALTETKFFPKAVEAEIEFERNSEGKVTGLILRQGGQVIKGARK